MIGKQPPSSQKDFDARLSAAQRANQPKPPVAGGSSLGIAFRMSADLVSAVVVGGVIGWFLDEWLGTAPWLLLLFFFLGVAAGIMNVMRTARAMNAAVLAENDGDALTRGNSENND